MLGRSAVDFLKTNLSFSDLYLIRSAIEINFIPHCFAYLFNSGRRDIEPSWFWISHITPAGYRPDSKAKSTAASVWPALLRTPPFFARNGKTCPGLLKLSGVVLGLIATCMVLALSSAEIPVLTLYSGPASIDTVKAVWLESVFLSTINGKSNSSNFSPCIARQISPLPSTAIKFICCGVANWAAHIKSPSFSLFSSSTTITHSPFLIAAKASLIGSNSIFKLSLFSKIVPLSNFGLVSFIIHIKIRKVFLL